MDDWFDFWVVHHSLKLRWMKLKQQDKAPVTQHSLHFTSDGPTFINIQEANSLKKQIINLQFLWIVHFLKLALLSFDDTDCQDNFSETVVLYIRQKLQYYHFLRNIWIYSTKKKVQNKQKQSIFKAISPTTQLIIQQPISNAEADVLGERVLYTVNLPFWVHATPCFST